MRYTRRNITRSLLRSSSVVFYFVYESRSDDVYYQYSSWQTQYLNWPFSYLTTIEFCCWYMIAKASEQEPSLKLGELRDVLSPGHRIHDCRSRGRRSDLLTLPTNTGTATLSGNSAICLQVKVPVLVQYLHIPVNIVSWISFWFSGVWKTPKTIVM